MKKLLIILGALTISASGAALVVACNKPAKPDNKVEPTNPTNPGDANPGEGKPGELQPGQPTKPGEGKPGDSAKPSDPKKPDDKKPPVTPPAKPSTTVNWNSVFRDSLTGEDIQLYPTKEQLEKEEKRLADEVKKILEKNKKDNEKELKDFISKHKKEYEALVKDYKAKIWRDSPTGLDITTHYDKDAVKRADAILDEWTKILLDKIQKANEKTFKDFISKHKKEYEALVKDYKAKIWRDSVTGDDINLNPTPEDIEREEKRLKEWVEEYLEKNRRENEALEKYVFKTAYNKIFIDSATGEDIQLHPTKEQIDAEKSKLDAYINEELKKNKELNKAHTKPILEQEVTKLEAKIKAIESEYDKKEKNLISLINSSISDTKRGFEEAKKQLDSKKQNNEQEISNLEKTINGKVDVKEELEKTKENLANLTEFLEEANALVEEHTQIDNNFNKETEKGRELEKQIEKLTSDIDTNKMLGESISAIEKQIQETKDGFKMKISDNKKEEDQIEAKEKELKEIRNKFLNDTSESNEFYYNFGKSETFRYQQLGKLDDQIKETKAQKASLAKLKKELQDNEKKAVDELAIKKVGAKQAKSKIPMLMKTLEETTKAKTELDKHLLDINNEVTKNKELLEIYKGNVEQLTKEIQNAKNTETDLTKKLSDYKTKMTALEAEKKEIEKALNELEATAAKTISDSMSNLEKGVQRLDKEAFEKEKQINSKILEIKELINTIEKL
ncbi:MAG6090-like repeat-containing lipoprotein [Mycoplasma feriruminatoris]|uniref:Chromosome partition protein Smc n=1 Tax=Mycoplasma feriruminatoris TaxID=1179777 RepID=A0AAX3TG34_9MOLU|nr:lipoprotein [Mycoplasma feriruminatoris]WFQ93004.1 hypothetical protein MFERI14822_00797 [Mycoplasma feriruminatoris]